jgi:hypothetical protein
MPGLIDIYSPMPAGDLADAGAGLLAFGVTTLLSPDAPADFAADAWAGDDTPGPLLLRSMSAVHSPASHIAPELRLVTLDHDTAPTRQLAALLRDWQDRGVAVLAENWSKGLGMGADLLLGSAELPSSPLGHRYQDTQLLTGRGPITMVSALADAATPGLEQLIQSRQGLKLHGLSPLRRRFVAPPHFAESGTSLVVGSLPSGLPAGLSTQAELRALQAAGAPPALALHAATGAAADVLGLGGQLGRIVPGARANLLLIAGDPLGDVGATLDIVAVIRDGHFFSLASLLERAGRVD